MRAGHQQRGPTERAKERRQDSQSRGQPSTQQSGPNGQLRESNRHPGEGFRVPGGAGWEQLHRSGTMDRRTRELTGRDSAKKGAPKGRNAPKRPEGSQTVAFSSLVGLSGGARPAQQHQGAEPRRRGRRQKQPCQRNEGGQRSEGGQSPKSRGRTGTRRA